MSLILVVEDEPKMRASIRYVLEEEGYEVIEAENGEAALAVFSESIPDMVILDVELGEGIDGFEVCKKIREHPYGSILPVMFLTGKGTIQDILQGFDKGANDYIRKPFAVADFLSRVSKQTNRLEQQRQAFALHEQPFRVGVTLPGKFPNQYKIVKTHSFRNMGVIFQGHRVSDLLPVMIKTLHHSNRNNPKELRRFLYEANTTVDIDHPNLISGIEVVKNPDYCFFVMEYIEGEDLQQLLKKIIYLDQGQALDYVIQIAQALEYLNARGLVHRDIKPANIILTHENRIVLIDLGICKSMWTNNCMTTKGIVLGTPNYVSPEQAIGREIDIRSDIYSLGATFYHLITGAEPFPGNEVEEVIKARFLYTPRAPHLIWPGVSKRISKIIRKMMACQQSKRYQTPQELLKDLRNVRKSLLAGNVR